MKKVSKNPVSTNLLSKNSSSIKTSLTLKNQSSKKYSKEQANLARQFLEEEFFKAGPFKGQSLEEIYEEDLNSEYSEDYNRLSLTSPKITSKKSNTFDQTLQPQNCWVVQPNLYEKDVDYNYKLTETVNLARALDLNVVGSDINKIRVINANTFLTKGFLENLSSKLANAKVEALVVNHNISAVQQRNLENMLDVKVLDRNGLIINIFAKRAKSREGKMQAQLAYLMYQKSRLVKAWSHLERQRGGGGFIGGPGETQKELDKRMISDQIKALKLLLDKVKLNRDIQGAARKKHGDKINQKIVALVGYTNSGKSTLFNALTHAQVFTKDLLFATLDPTIRSMDIGNKQIALLLDTVGFISDLPHHLITAFHSTLEEVKNADLILHIIDASSDNYEKQIHSVKEVLQEIGVDEDTYSKKTIEIYNKIDLLDINQREHFEHVSNYKTMSLLISALNNLNLNKLKKLMFEYFFQDFINKKLTLHFNNYPIILYLYENAVIVDKYEVGEKIYCEFLISKKNLNILEDKLANLSLSSLT
ncbi:GTPase HflX [Candidatus Hepatincolaceae symbiont of Richtersius coronifer]